MNISTSKPTASPASSSKPTSRPLRRPGFPNFTVGVQVPKPNHPGADSFFSNCNPFTALSSAVYSVIETLYTPARSSINDDHKEIHLSLDYIRDIPSQPPDRRGDDIQGVLVREMVHCWQWNANGTAPSGLLTGIADFVRLKAGLGLPSWKKECGGDWDAGFHHTAYFLEWLEDTRGAGSVRKINDRLGQGKYIEKNFWKVLFGKDVSELWEDYSKTFQKLEGDSPEGDEKAKEGEKDDYHESVPVENRDQEQKVLEEENDEMVPVENHAEEQKVHEEKEDL